MALDFHIAKNNSEALHKEASASFEFQPHEFIFYRGNFPVEKFPLFGRLKDYYKDAKYSPDELETLILEIKDIMNWFQGNSQIEEQLNNIVSACSKAVNEKTSVWVYCD